MKGDTLLDYAEFQLSPKRTRCELVVSAEGATEKLASGFLKPFLTHLRAVEKQIAKSSQVIRLEGHPKSTWLTKGTLERFVRFVSTPEVIERVKTIEDELGQLEQVRSALANTFGQIDDRFDNHQATLSSSGVPDGREGTPIGLRRPSDEGGSDASKRELLRAMDARLSALHQEQNAAFARARAAGFDSNNMTDLMAFAKHFGADRLNDACKRFLALLKKQTVYKEVRKDFTYSNKSDMLSSAAGNEAKSALIKVNPRESLTFPNGHQKGIDTSKANGLTEDQQFAKLHNIMNSPHHASTGYNASNMDLMQRRGNAEKIHLNGFNGPHVEGIGATMHAGDEALASQHASDSSSHIVNKLALQKMGGASVENGFSAHLHPATQKVEELRSSERFEQSTFMESNEQAQEDSQADAIDQNESHHSSQDDRKSMEETLKKIKASDPEPSNAKEDAPVRRLSVQAAISLFESKKNDTTETPVKKLVKQESRRTLVEGSNSPSEKLVLRRWSSMNHPSSTEENPSQDKNLIVDNKETEKSPEAQSVAINKESTNKDFSASNVLKQERMHPQHMDDDHSRETVKSFGEHPKHTGPSFEDGAACPHTSKQRAGMNGMSATSETDVQVVQPVKDLIKDAKSLEGKESMPSKAKAPVTPGMTVLTTTKPLKDVAELKYEGPTAISGTGLDSNEKPDQQGKLSWNRPTTANLQVTVDTPASSRAKAANQATPKQPKNRASIVSQQPKPETMAIEESQTVESKEISGISNTGPRQNSQRRDSNSGRETSFAYATHVELHMQALVKIVQSQHQSSLNSSGEETVSRRFYDQYSKLRDAKLRRENPAKKAEREAKLKSMQETYERRKAEMEERAPRSVKKSNRTSPKQRTQKGALPIKQLEQVCKEEDEATDATDADDYCARYSNASSPVSTPKNPSTPTKQRAAKKVAQSPSKSSPTQRNSPRTTTSISPNAASKNPSPIPSQWKPIVSSTGFTDNSPGNKTVAHSMAMLSSSSSSRIAASAKVHPSHTRSTTDSVPVDDGNAIAKDDTQQPTTNRKNVTSPTMLGPPSGQQEAATVDARANALSSMQEAKTFLRKGRGIGPGAGPGIMKQKASVADLSKSSESDGIAEPKIDGETIGLEDLKQEAQKTGEDHDTGDDEGLVEEGMATLAQNPSTMAGLEVHDGELLDKAQSTHVTREGEEDEAYPPDNGRMQTSSDTTPDEISEEDFQDSSVCTPQDFQDSSVSTPQGLFMQGGRRSLEEKAPPMSASLSELLTQRSGERLNAAPSISFREPYKQYMGYFDHSKASSQGTAMHHGMASARFSPPPSLGMDSPTGSPALWGGVQARYPSESDLLYASNSRQQPGGVPKHVSLLPPPPKEASKGFKRLLHFGRKSRTSEAAAVDCVSVSTTSEGDDDAEDVGSDDLVRKARMQQPKRFEHPTNGGEQQQHYLFQDPGAVQLRGSSIPPPPANFKPREDQLPGGNLLKAPRSFFSLSSFRSSKGSEGKSR